MAVAALAGAIASRPSARMVPMVAGMSVVSATSTKISGSLASDGWKKP